MLNDLTSQSSTAMKIFDAPISMPAELGLILFKVAIVVTQCLLIKNYSEHRKPGDYTKRTVYCYTGILEKQHWHQIKNDNHQSKPQARVYSATAGYIN